MVSGKNPSKGRHRILIVDDHPIFRHGLIQLIEQEDDLEVCGEAENYHEAWEAIGNLNPDMIIIDITLKELSGIDLIKDVHKHYTGIPMLVVSMHDESLYAERSFRAGAKGYIMKQEASGLVVQAIHQVLRGGFYASGRVTERILAMFIQGSKESAESPLQALTDREIEVFTLIGQGFSVSEIGQRLHVSVKTVGTYRDRIKRKLNLKSATELLRYALNWVEKGQ